MRTPNPPWMSLSRTIGIKSAEKQRIRAGKLPAGSIPAPFEALGKTGGGLSCRKTASPRSTGRHAAGGRCPHGQPPFSPFQSRPAGQGFLCSSRPHPAVCGLPHFPRNSQKCALASPVFPCSSRKRRIAFPRFFPAAEVIHPRAVCGDGGSGGGKTKETNFPATAIPFLRFLEGGAGGELSDTPQSKEWKEGASDRRATTMRLGRGEAILGKKFPPLIFSSSSLTPSSWSWVFSPG